MSKSTEFPSVLSLRIPEKTFDGGYNTLSVKDLLRLKKNIMERIAVLPVEGLITSKSNGVWQYYYYCSTHPSQKVYIPSKSVEYARQLATRDYYGLLVEEIDRQLKVEESGGLVESRKLYDVFENMTPARKALVTPVFLSNSEYVERWAESHPGGANSYEMITGYDTERGEVVRSKSEKIIADKLFNMGIPYSYECRLSIKGSPVMYPDFTVLNVAARKTWYWEHFGLTDDGAYRDNMSHKLNIYESNGLFLGDGLIITTEGEHTSLDIKLIGAKIQKYLIE